MKNPLEPTPAEIREWAYNAESREPQQDWDVSLARGATPETVEAFLDGASDDACPQQTYFLHVLYLTLAEAHRRGTLALDAWRPQYGRFVDLAKNRAHPKIKEWRFKARRLLDQRGAGSVPEWFRDEAGR